MKKFVMTRNLFNGDEYNACREFETEQEFLDWAATKKHLGKINWSLPKYTDDDGIEHFPDGCELDSDGNPIPVIVKHPESVGEDMDGNPIVTPAWDETQYKMPDQWSYTVEDLTAQLALEEKKDRVRSRINKAKHRKVCQEVLDAISDYNEERALNPSTLLANESLAAMFGYISQSRGNALHNALASYTDTTYYDTQFIDDLKTYVADELGL